MMKRGPLVSALWLVALLVLAAPLHADERFPSAPVKIIVPAAPGGGFDVFARLLGKRLAERWGEQVLVDNRAGGAKCGCSPFRTAKRAASAPEVPSVQELGMPGFDFSLWGGIFAPAATPREIVMRLNQAITAVLQRPEVSAQMARQGSEVIRTTPEEFGRFVRAESAKYAEIVKRIK